MKIASQLSPVQARWRGLAPREQALVMGAGWLIGVALVWLLLMLPPLRTLSLAGTQQRSMDSQLQKMRALQMQAQAMQSQPKLNRDDALRALEASVSQRLGSGGQLNVVGDRATVTLRNVPAGALAQWLTQARVNARAIPSEVRLVRSAGSPAASAAAAAPPPANTQTPAMQGGTAMAMRGAGAAPAPAPAPALPAPVAAPVAAGAGVAWDGTLVMSLPSQ